MDYQGIAVLLTALAAMGGTIVTSVLAVLNYKVARSTHGLVNGLTVQKDNALRAAAFSEGEKAGVAIERSDPQVSSSPGRAGNT